MKKKSPKNRSEIASRLSNRKDSTFAIHALLLKNIPLNERTMRSSRDPYFILFIKNGYSLGKLQGKQHLTIIRVLEQSWQFLYNEYHLHHANAFPSLTRHCLHLIQVNLYNIKLAHY